MSNKIVNYKTHRLEGVTFRYDEVFDWFVLSEFHCIRANEALTQEVMWHKNKMHHRIRDLAVKMQYQSNSKVSFVHVESLAMRKAFYWYDQIRPKEVKDWARHLQSLFHQAVKKGGWNEVTDTTLRTWLKHEPGGSVRMISVSKDIYVHRRKGTPYFGLELLRSIPCKYRTKVIGFKPYYYNGRLWNYYPVFDAETQKEWDDAQRRFDEGATRYYAEKASGGYCGD